MIVTARTHAFRCRVWLNDVEVTDECFYADDERGIVKCYVRGEDGQFFVSGKGVAECQKEGRVHIEMVEAEQSGDGSAPVEARVTSRPAQLVDASCEFCPAWGTAPMCNCKACQREIDAGTHISQTAGNPEYIAARRRLGLKVRKGLDG